MQASLRRQLLLRLWVPLASLLLAGAVFAYTLAHHFASAVHDRWLVDSAMTLATQLRGDAQTLSLNLPPAALEMFEWDSVDRIYWQVVAPPDRVVMGNFDFPRRFVAAASGEPAYYDATIDGQPVRLVSLSVRSRTVPSRTATIIVAETTLKRQAMTRDIIAALVPLQVAILVAAGALIWFGVTSSLRGLDDITRRLRGYQPDRLVPLEGADQAPSEVRPLMLTLNGLIAKLSQANGARQRFVANAAHQLRTPLAALQVETERALREQNPERNREALTKVRDAVTRLRHLTQQLLALTRSDASSARTLALIDVDLPDLAKQELERWADAAVERNVDLGYEGPEHGVVVRGEPQLLRELIGNLVDNAIRYGRQGGVVTLGVHASPPSISVDDDGPGIAPDQREHVLDPFYRVPGTIGDGCGLGLAIASEIAARHGAALHIAERVPRGARIEVRFEHAVAATSGAHATVSAA